MYGSKLLSCSLTASGVKDQRQRNFVTSHCSILHGKLSRKQQGKAARLYIIGARVIVVVVCVCMYVCMYVCMCVCVTTHNCRLTHWNHKTEIPTCSQQ